MSDPDKCEICKKADMDSILLTPEGYLFTCLFCSFLVKMGGIRKDQLPEFRKYENGYIKELKGAELKGMGVADEAKLFYDTFHDEEKDVN